MKRGFEDGFDVAFEGLSRLGEGDVEVEGLGEIAGALGGVICRPLASDGCDTFALLDVVGDGLDFGQIGSHLCEPNPFFADPPA